MIKWYFNNYFIENKPLFWISVVVILMMILLTIYFVYKELRSNHVNK